jgi:hypothetical protein
LERQLMTVAGNQCFPALGLLLIWWGRGEFLNRKQTRPLTFFLPDFAVMAEISVIAG